MAVVTLRPDATDSVSGTWTVNGGAGLPTVMTDGPDAGEGTRADFNRAGTSDDTYHSGRRDSPYAIAQLRMETFALPTGAKVVRMTPRIRAGVIGSQFGTDSGTLPSFGLMSSVLGGGGGGWSGYVEATFVPSQYAFNNHVGPNATAANFTGVTEITQGVIDYLIVYYRPGYNASYPNSTIAFTEAYIDVEYNERPGTPTISTPTAAQVFTDTNQPQLTWTYTDPDGDAQQQVEVELTIGGVTTVTLLTQGGQTYTFPSLSNGSYSVRVRVKDTGSGSWSDWSAARAFTVNVTPPPTPTLTTIVAGGSIRLDATAAGAPTSEGIEIECNANRNLLPINDATLEGSIGGWSAIAPVVVARSMEAAFSGLYGLLVTAGGTGARLVTTTTQVPVVPTKTYEARAKIRPLGPARDVAITINWYTAAHAMISQSSGAAFTEALGQPVEVVASGAAPATAAYALLQLNFYGSAATDMHAVDDLQIAMGTGIPFEAPGATSWTTLTDAVDSGTASRAWDHAAYIGGKHYRARSYRTTAQGRIYSPYSTVIAAAPSITKDWTLTDLVDGLEVSLLDTPNLFIENELAWSEDERAEAMTAIGRSDPIVSRDSIQTPVYSLTIFCKTEADYTRLNNLRSRQRTLLLRRLTGEHKYVILGPGWQVTRPGYASWRRVVTALTEVSRPV